MAHFTYLPGRGSLANWSIGTTVAPSEFWWFESSIYACLNGDAGGSWAPAAAINLGGTAGLELATTTPLNALGPVTVGATSATALTINSTSHFYSAVTCEGNLTIGTGANLIVNGPVCFIEANSMLNGTATFNDTATFNGAVSIKHSSTFGNSLSHIFTVLGILAMGDAPPVGLNNGRATFNSAATTISGNVIAGVTDENIVIYTSLGGASRTVTLLHANARNGDWKVYINNDATDNITVHDETTGAISYAVAPGGMCFAVYIGGTGSWYAATCNP